MSIDQPDTAPSDPSRGDAPGSPRPGRWRRRLAKLGVVLLVAGVVGLGATLGWFLRGWIPGGGVGEKTVEVTRPVRIDADVASPGSLPNVLGLPLDEARQAYADAGVNPEQIGVESVDYVAPEGTVVTQRPAAASKLPREAVTLVLARTAKMPELIGTDADAARKQLADIGVGTTTQVRYEPAVDPGEVAGTTPAAGELATPDATLVVSEAPSSIDLSDLDPSTSGCSIGDAEVDGSTAADALVCQLYSDQVSAEYKINSRVTGLQGTLALADGAPSGTRVKVEIRNGRRVVDSFVVTSKPVDIDVKTGGGRTLTVDATRADAGDESVSLVLVDGRMVGARSGIDALAKSSTP
jgi:hypothetical protein